MSAAFIARRVPHCACLIALAAACADSSTGPSIPASAIASLAVQQASVTADITGVWTYHEDAIFLLYDFAGGHAAKTFRCSNDGTYTFAQTGTAFTGSFDQVGVCTAADGTSFPNNFTDVAVHGTIEGRHLRYVDDVGCSFEGTVRGPTLSKMGGSTRCGGGGIFGTYRASWSASR